ncbi:MAG TPA: DnaA/Hda family protein [Xanthobacteraceae bacterium]|nr:DnaA/Hda family protein [Xanthobacteraceae bacterium]
MPGPAASRSARPRQLALALGHEESLAREDFLEGPCNAAALKLLEAWPDWPAPVVTLTGPEGSGKSHLAAIWAAASGARVIAGRALAEISPPMALATGALVIEDLAAEEFDEASLFHMLNLAREEGAFVLLTARTPPAGWNVGLRDLASRLRAVPAVALAAPDDALLRSVIVKLCADRQLAVDEAVVGYLASRIERSFGAARAAVARLDREALRQKRPVNRSLAADLFRDAEA